MPSSSLRPSTKINKSQTPARTKEKSTTEPDQKKISVHRRSSSGVTSKKSVDQMTTSSPHSTHKDNPSLAKGVVGKSLAPISSRVRRMTTRSSIKSLQSQPSDSTSLSSPSANQQDTHAEASPTLISEEESATMALIASTIPKASTNLPSRKSNIPISRPASTASLFANPSSRAPAFAHRRSISLAFASPPSSALEQSDDSSPPSIGPPMTTTPMSLRRSVSSSFDSPSNLVISTPSDPTPDISSSPSRVTAIPKISMTPSPIKISRPVVRSLVPKTSSSSSGRPSTVSGSLAFSAVQNDSSRSTPRNQSIPILKKGHRPSLSTSTVPSKSANSLGRKRPDSMSITVTSTSLNNKSANTPHSVSSPGKLSGRSEKADLKRTPIKEVNSEDSMDKISVSSPVVEKVSVVEKTRRVIPKSPLKEMTEDGVDCSPLHHTDRPFPSLYPPNQSSSSQMLKNLLTPSATPYGSRVRPRPLVARNSLVHFDSMAQSFALEDEGDSLLHLPEDGPNLSFPDLSGPDLESPPGSLKRKARMRPSLVAPTKAKEHAKLVSLQDRLDESLLAQTALSELLEREISKVRELEEHLAERQIEEDLLKASPVKPSAPTFSRPFLGKPMTEVEAVVVQENDLRLKTEVARLKIELESSTGCIEHLQTGLSELTEQLTSAHGDIDSLQHDLISIQSKNSKLEADNVSREAELEAQQIASTVEGRKKASKAWSEVKMRAMGELEDLKGERDLLAILETSIRLLEREVRSGRTI